MVYSAKTTNDRQYKCGKRLTGKIHDFSRRPGVPVDSYGVGGWRAGRNWTRAYDDVNARNTDRRSEHGHRKTFNVKPKVTV